MATNIDVEILEDGKLKVTTSAIADSLHLDADNLLDDLNEIIGGEVVKENYQDEETKAFWKKHRMLRGGKLEKIKN